MDRYTFIVEYRGGTYISQCIAETLEEAFKEWIFDKTKEFLDEKRYNKLLKIYNDECPIKIRNTINVWCCFYVLNRSSMLINIVKTK